MSAQDDYSSEQKELLKKIENHSFLSIAADINEIIRSKSFKTEETWFDYSLLVAALKKQHKTMTNFFLKHDCRVTRKANIHFDDSPLYLAVKLGDASIVSKLLRKGARVNDDNYNKRSPLYFALEMKEFKIVSLMLQHCNFKNFDPNQKNDILCFHVACLFDMLTIIQKFIRYGFSVNTLADCDTQDWHSFSPLHFAVRNRSLKTLNYLMENNADFFIQTDEGQTPLHLSYYEALEKTYLDNTLIRSLIEMMLELEKPINSVDSNGLSYFHIICTTEDLVNVQIFLSKNIDINSTTSFCSKVNAGYSALHFAISNNCLKVVKLLLKNGADVNKPAKGHLTPLHLACKLNKIDIVRLLLRFGADCTAKDEEDRSPLHIAFYDDEENNELIDLLLEEIPKNNNVTDSQGISHFHIACLRNQLDIIQSFLQHGVLVDMCIKPEHKLLPGYSALHLAVRSNRKNIVDLLLKHNVNVSIGKKVQPLHLACALDGDKFKDLILEIQNGSDNSCSSILKNHLDIITSLLDRKCDVNAKDFSGKTPLMYILESNPFTYYHINLINSTEDIRNHSRTIINLLLNHKADIHTCTNSKKTVLHVICEKAMGDKVKLANLFLNKGVDVDAKDVDGLTPLHMAIKSMQKDLIELFLNYSANVNVASKNGMTPLHLAANSDFNSDTITSILLAHGADINAVNVNKEKPLHMAMSSRNINVIKLLLKSGADINDENYLGYPSVYFFYKNISRYNLENTLMIQNFIENHVQKLDALTFYVSSKVRLYCSKSRERCEQKLEMMDETFKFHDITAKCLDELKSMKKMRIDRYTSLREILYKDQNEMTKHIKNEKFREIIKLSNLKNFFPHYYYLIKLQYRRGSERYQLLKPAKDSLNIITGLNLPDACSERIFRYLCNKNLQNIIEANCNYTDSLKRKLSTNSCTNDQPLKKKKKN